MHLGLPLLRLQVESGIGVGLHGELRGRVGVVLVQLPPLGVAAQEAHDLVALHLILQAGAQHGVGLAHRVVAEVGQQHRVALDPLDVQRHRQIVVEAEEAVHLAGCQHRRVVLAGHELQLVLIDVVDGKESRQPRRVGARHPDLLAHQILGLLQRRIGQRQDGPRELLVLGADNDEVGPFGVGAGDAVGGGDVDEGSTADGVGVTGHVGPSGGEFHREAQLLEQASVLCQVGAAELHGVAPRQLIGDVRAT